MVSIVDMLKRSEKFSLAFDRSMPIRFQQQFWQLIAFLDKHDILGLMMSLQVIMRCVSNYLVKFGVKIVKMWS